MGNWRSTTGKEIALQTGTALNVISFIFYFTGFASPYWVQSWPRIYSGFKKIGLWEACFAGLVLPFDPREKAYNGCWWIFAPEYEDIRQFMMPWWFIITQLICTIVFTLMILNLIFLVVLWVKSGRVDKVGGEKRAPINIVQAVTVITFFNAIATSATVILFGMCYYFDRDWMPHRQLNYLSWSYGLVIVSAFFSIFAVFAFVVYNRLVRQEYREPGSMRTPLAAPSPQSSYNSPTTPIAPGYNPALAYPGSQSGYPGSQSGYPGSQSGYPGSQSEYPGSQSGYPGSQRGYTGSQSSYPGSKSGYHGSDSQI